MVYGLELIYKFMIFKFLELIREINKILLLFDDGRLENYYS